MSDLELLSFKLPPSIRLRAQISELATRYEYLKRQLSYTRAEARELRARVRELEAQRDRWKQRALAAERAQRKAPRSLSPRSKKEVRLERSA